jgi:predicted GNAT family N-acyltransferase
MSLAEARAMGADSPETATNVHVRPVTSPEEVKKCQEIRMEVFVADQGVPVWLELEHEDMCTHFLARREAGDAVGTGRLRPTDVFIKFERVCPYYSVSIQ